MTADSFSFDRSVASEAATGAATDTDDPYGPVHIDIERMERGLAGPRWTVPNGLTAEEFVEYMDACAAGKIAPDDTPPGTQADTNG